MALRFDGAFGTYYARLYGAAEDCERANVTDAARVLAVHKAYIDAGVAAIKTNTFAANGGRYGAEELARIVESGWDLANKAAAGRDVAVFADIGVNTGADAEARYLEVVRLFLARGADKFLFETLDAFAPILPALDVLKDAGATVYVTFAASPEGVTRAGLHYRALILEAMAHKAVAAAGLNCMCGPAHMLGLVRRLGKTPKPFIAMPNAGYANRLEGHAAFRDNPGYFREKLAELVAAGAEIVGGCCGTTPEHLSAEEPKAQGAAAATRPVVAVGAVTRKKRKPILVEVDPPADGDCAFILATARKLKAANVAAMTLADSPLGKARADSLMTAAKVKTETGLDAIPHLTCRDKNKVAMKAGLLGARMFGVDKVLAVTGDPLFEPGRKGAGVFDFHAAQLIAYIKQLNEEAFGGAPYEIGGALNVNAARFEAEMERCLRKAESGASFFLSQPIYHEAAARNFETARRALPKGCKLYAGVLPVAGYKNALFLNNEVSGIDIPADVLARLKDAPPDAVADVSVGFAARAIENVYDAADGFYLMTPLKRVSLVLSLIGHCFDDEG